MEVCLPQRTAWGIQTVISYRLVTVLPKLEAVELGETPCDSDTCPTTIRSLLSFYIHCANLRYLNIHFRAMNLRADMLDLLGDAYPRGLHSRPKRILKALMTEAMRLALSDYGPMVISMGVLMIFPSLTTLAARTPTWVRLQLLVKVFGQMGKLGVMTEQLMRYLDLVRGSDDRETSSVSLQVSLGSAGGHW